MIRPDDCKCGHPLAAHDAGECWAIYYATDPRCGCTWYEPISPAVPSEGGEDQ